MRADSAVEPTRSENITVTWRRSAVSWGLGPNRAPLGSGAAGTAPASLRSREHYSPMPQQDAYVFQVLISYMGKRRDSDPVLSKTLHVLGHAELFEPVCKVMHSAAPQRRSLHTLR